MPRRTLHRELGQECTYLLLCCPVLCRNAFRVALRSSLIFSYRKKVSSSVSSPRSNFVRGQGKVYMGCCWEGKAGVRNTSLLFLLFSISKTVVQC